MPEGGGRARARQAVEERTEASSALSAWRPSPTHPRLHLTTARALGKQAQARRRVHGAFGRPIPLPSPSSGRPACCGYCSAPRLRCLALLVLRAWHWLRLE